MSTVSACAANYTTPCAPCYIAASTAVHSFPYDLTTIEVEATPYIFPGNNGSSSTSWKYVTLTQTLHANSSGEGGLKPTGTSDGMVFSNPTGVTWTTRDLTLTYPTTYVEYHDFSGVGADVSNATACAQTDSVSQFILASETVEMSFVMQWMPASTAKYASPGPATSIPPEILSYLDSIPAVTSQLGGQPIKSWLPANVPPECTIPLRDQPGECQSGCVTGLPTATMYYTNISTMVQPASIQTYTAYSWNTPSYGYITRPETTVYSTSISVTTLVNTKGNYTTVSCFATCVSPEESTSSAALSTFKLTTASVLTTINKDPIFATVPGGILDVEPTPKPNVEPTPKPNAEPKPTPTPAQARPLPNPSPDTITVKPPTPNDQQTKVTPSALPVQEPQRPDDAPNPEPTPCTDALCGLTAADGASPEPTENLPAGDGISPDSTKPNGGEQNDNTADGDEDEQNEAPNNAFSGAVVTVDSQEMSISLVSGEGLVVETQTIAPGNAVTLPDSQMISVGASAVYIGSSAIAFTVMGGGKPAPSGVVFTNAEGEVKTAAQISPGVFVAGSSTLTAGQQYTLANGDVATVGSGGPLPSSGSGAVFTAAGQTLTASAIQSGAFAVGDSTISAGQDLTLSNGGIVHANSDGVQLGTSTLSFSAFGAGTTGAGIYTIDQQALTPGGEVTQGTATISLDDSGQTYYVNGKPTLVSSGIISMNGTKYTAHTTAGSTDVGDYIMEGISSAAGRLTSTARASGSETGSEQSASPSSSSAQELSAVIGCVVGLVIVAIAAVAL